MAREFLTDEERENFNSFPKNLSNDDLITFFTLSSTDKNFIPINSSQGNKLGLAVQLCTLRFLGFCPDNIKNTPTDVTAYVAKQLYIDPEQLDAYAKREQTRTDHLQKVQNYLGFRKATPIDFELIDKWLVERALEHSRSMLLLEMVCDKLKKEKIIRPGITILERMVVTAKQNAHTETFNLLSNLLTDNFKQKLNNLIISEEIKRETTFNWLKRGALTSSSRDIQETAIKIAWLKENGIHNFDLSKINPNRLKYLAQIARNSTNQAIQRFSDDKKYPVLIAFLNQSLIDITDETIEMFDKNLSECYSKAGKSLEAYQKSIAKLINDKLYLLNDLGILVLDENIENSRLRDKIFEYISYFKLQSEIDECKKLLRPKKDDHFDFFKDYYVNNKHYVADFLENIKFNSNKPENNLLEALELIKDINKEKIRHLPQNAPREFISSKWENYVINGSKLERMYYELCALSELKDNVRSGDIWVSFSRKHRNIETYIMDKKNFENIKTEMFSQLNLNNTPENKLKALKTEIETSAHEVDLLLQKGDDIRLEKGKIKITPLEAKEIPESAAKLRKIISERLPKIELTNLLIEVDKWTNFSSCFENVTGYDGKTKDFLKILYGSILAQGCNLGIYHTSQIADLNYENLVWCTNWYLRDETLKNAVNNIVNYQHKQEITKYWGTGSFSSSDGQRFPVSAKTKNAKPLPKYFGYGKGLTFYTWTSDQYSQYGTKVIPVTMRDATYVLDEILDNETDLEILEHTTDTAGYTALVFALFNLLGMLFSPRIKDIGDQTLYCFDRNISYEKLNLKGKINTDIIYENWDEILRVTASLKFGWVTASLLISKLQAYPRKNTITKALQEYGRIVKTSFILKYYKSKEFRRYIHRQLNKGEALHALRKYLFWANHGKINTHFLEEHLNQALCLNLLTNAVTTWNTVYISEIISQLKTEGYKVNDEDITYISPTRFKHINPYGKFTFDLDMEYNREILRPIANSAFKKY